MTATWPKKAQKLKYSVFQNINIPEITPQIALFGFFCIGNQKQDFLLINHLVLIFKHYLYMSRDHGAVCFTDLKLHLIEIKTIEQNISPCSKLEKGKMSKKMETR